MSSDDSEPLVEKHRPTRVSHVQGHTKAVREIRSWIQQYQPGDDPQLLVGDAGVGKTSAIQAIANTEGLPLTEINASDARRKDDVTEFVDQARSRPISAHSKIVLFDEVDSLSTSTSYQALYDLMDDSPNPLVFVCNDDYQVPYALKKRCTERTFTLRTSSIRAKLREIIDEEGYDLGAATLAKLADRNSLRDAIQDLQTLMEQDSGGDTESAETLNADSDGRAYDESVFDGVDKVIQGERADIDTQPPDALRWIDKNIRGRYRLVEAAMAWEALSRADMWLGRMPNDDYYWWRYVSALLKEVGPVRITDAYDGYIKKQSPDSYGRSNGVPSGVEEVFEKIQQQHGLACTVQEFNRWYLPELKQCDDSEIAQIAVESRLDPSQVALLGISRDYYERYIENDTEELAQDRADSHDGGPTESSFMT